MASVKITFASAPTLTGTIAQEFTLVRTKKANGGGTDNTVVTIGSATVSGNVVTLSNFSGAATIQGTGTGRELLHEPRRWRVLPDGEFRVHGADPNFVLADNGAASTVSGSFFRLAGDFDGNRSVGGSDTGPFVAGFGASGVALGGDLNLDNSVGGQDTNLFVAGFGGSV